MFDFNFFSQMSIKIFALNVRSWITVLALEIYWYICITSFHDYFKLLSKIDYLYHMDA